MIRQTARAFCAGFGGHREPVTCSLSASPLPTASQKRPGNMLASVAAAGRAVPNDSPVPSSAAPSQLHANPDLPRAGEPPVEVAGAHAAPKAGALGRFGEP